MATVADVLKRIERIKKDLEYVRTFQDKWKEQRERFPKIYEGILEQERFFLRKIEDMKQLRVDAAEPFASEAEAAPAPAPAVVPALEGGATPASANDSGAGEEKQRAATIDGIGEKLRKRSKIEPAVMGLGTDPLGPEPGAK